MRVEFYLIDAMEVANFAPIFHSLQDLGVDARMVAVPVERNTAGRGWFDFENAIAALDVSKIAYSCSPDYGSDAALTTQRSAHLRGYTGRKIRIPYTAGLYQSEELQEPRAQGFDGILALGPYAKQSISRWIDPSRVPITGFPKYDSFFLDPPAADVLKASLGIHAGSKVVAYLPTWESRSSIDGFLSAIETIAEDEDVFVLIKPHHCTPRFEPERWERLQGLLHAELLPASYPSIELFAISDLVIADALSGALAESLLTDPLRPIVCLCPNLPLLKAQIDTGFAQLGFTLNHPADLAPLVRSLLERGEESHERLDARRAARDLLFAYTDGTAGRRSAEAILGVIAREPSRPARPWWKFA